MITKAEKTPSMQKVNTYFVCPIVPKLESYAENSLTNLLTLVYMLSIVYSRNPHNFCARHLSFSLAFVCKRQTYKRHTNNLIKAC